MTALAVTLIAQLAATPACSVPGMVPKFWPAVVKSESHGDPWALRDDTANRSYYPPSADAAERIATSLMAEHHSIGVGLSQLTATSLDQFQSKFHMTIREALEPCANMRAGAFFYVDRALRIYNSGSPDRGTAYAQNVQSRVEKSQADVSVTPVEPEHPQPIVITPGDRDAKHPPPAWDVWGAEVSRRQQAADETPPPTKEEDHQQ